MKKTLTRITGITVVGLAVAAGLAFAQTDGVGPAGPGGRSTDPLNQPVPPTTPDASNPNALPAITQTPPAASAPDASTSTGTSGVSPDQGSRDNGSTATQPDGSAMSTADPTTTPRSPRADRN